MTKNNGSSLKDFLLESTKNSHDNYIDRLLREVFDRYNYHLEIAKKNHKFFRNANYLFSFLVPTYSAFLTYIISNDFISSKAVLGGFGLFLTILTIVSSILKP